MAATILQISATSVTIGASPNTVTVGPTQSYQTLNVEISYPDPDRRYLGSGRRQHVYGPSADSRSITIRGAGLSVPNLSALTLTSAQPVVVTLPDGSTVSLYALLAKHPAVSSDLRAGVTAWTWIGDEADAP